MLNPFKSFVFIFLLFPMLVFAQSEKPNLVMIQVEICTAATSENCLQINEENRCKDCKEAILGKEVDKKEIFLENGRYNEKTMNEHLEKMISKYSAEKPRLKFLESEDLDEITFRYYSYTDKEGRRQRIGVVLPSN